MLRVLNFKTLYKMFAITDNMKGITEAFLKVELMRLEGF